MKTLIQTLHHMFTAKILVALTSTKNWIAFIAIAPVIAFVEKFLFSDWIYLQYLLVLMALDFVTGVTAAWRKGQSITSKGFRDSVSKGVQYFALLILIHVLINVEINGDPVPLPKEWITDGAFIFLLAVEVKSIYENITAINNKLDFLKPVLEKLEQYIFKK